MMMICLWGDEFEIEIEFPLEGLKRRVSKTPLARRLGGGSDP
jgi:hypothetical protein